MAVSVTSEVQEPSSTASRSPVTAFRLWATRHRVLAALLAGFVAVHVGTIIAFWFGGVGLTRLDWPTANGLVYLPDANPTVQFFLGGTAHYLDGIIFALVFAIALAPHMKVRGSGASANLVKGLLFGIVLGILALGVMTPLVYAPARGSHAGFFSTSLGWNYMLSVMIFHVIYGLHLGLIYNPYDEDEAPDRSPATAS